MLCLSQRPWESCSINLNIGGVEMAFLNMILFIRVGVNGHMGKVQLSSGVTGYRE